MPNLLDQLKITARKEKGNAGTFVIAPLPHGFGHTLGNALRRTLLSSLSGAAVVSAEIEDVEHEFSTLRGVREDALNLLLNVKGIRVKLHSDNPASLKLDAKGPGEVTAGDLEIVGDAEVVNPDLVLANLADSKSQLKMQLLVEPGVGYSLADSRTSTRIGELMVDAVFSPLLKVAYRVEATRVGEKTDLDSLVLDIETDGTITPREAMEEASGLLVKYFRAVGNIEEEEVPAVPDAVDGVEEEIDDEDRIEKAGLSTRTTNALLREGIKTKSALAALEKEDVAAIKGIGATALDELGKLLEWS